MGSNPFKNSGFGASFGLGPKLRLRVFCSIFDGFSSSSDFRSVLSSSSSSSSGGIEGEGVGIGGDGEDKDEGFR